MPQGGARTPTEKVDFKRMLQNINILYLGCSVLILQELSYLSRFWFDKLHNGSPARDLALPQALTHL